MTNSARLIAIGDIHGCAAALETVLMAVAPTAADTLVTLGDYVDRGPDSRAVIDMLMAIARHVPLVPLLGNHDEMMLKVCAGRRDLFADWLVYGGNATLASYHTLVPDGIWPKHVEFLAGCRLYHETERHFFVHGNYQAGVPLSEQPREVLMWESLKKRQPGPHISGKTAIVGHSSQKSGKILDLGYLQCIDTWCYGEGWLTALDVHSGRIWQADRLGRLRGK